MKKRMDSSFGVKLARSLDHTYGELVCTGAVFESTKQLIRVYPVPLPCLDAEKIFKKYQWIEASICKSGKDTRPEGYKINFNDIENGSPISMVRSNWEKRAEWIPAPSNVVPSVEALQEQKKEVTEVKFEPISFDEKIGAEEKIRRCSQCWRTRTNKTRYKLEAASG